MKIKLDGGSLDEDEAHVLLGSKIVGVVSDEYKLTLELEDGHVLVVSGHTYGYCALSSDVLTKDGGFI